MNGSGRTVQLLIRSIQLLQRVEVHKLLTLLGSVHTILFMVFIVTYTICKGINPDAQRSSTVTSRLSMQLEPAQFVRT